MTKKKTNVGDLPARSDRARATKGGATIAAAGRQTAAYQHNQTDLEFVRAQAREIKGGALTGDDVAERSQDQERGGHRDPGNRARGI